LVVCRTAGCQWEGIRFPLHGVDPNTLGDFICDGGCGMLMDLEWGEPHPTSVIACLTGYGFPEFENA
jgi:hypothetical protein